MAISLIDTLYMNLLIVEDNKPDTLRLYEFNKADTRHHYDSFSILYMFCSVLRERREVVTLMRASTFITLMLRILTMERFLAI